MSIVSRTLFRLCSRHFVLRTTARSSFQRHYLQLEIGWGRHTGVIALQKNAVRQIVGSFLTLRANFFQVSRRNMTTEIDKDELRKRLTPLQWHVTQEKGTERPYTGCYNKFYEKGTYTCVVCDQELFSSDTKYDSGCGWPAFNEVLDQGRIKLTKDTSHVGGNLLLLIAKPDMVRTEVTCSQCGAHLGHVFNDGPKPTRKRFCINSASICFHPAGEEKKPSGPA